MSSILARPRRCARLLSAAVVVLCAAAAGQTVAVQEEAPRSVIAPLSIDTVRTTPADQSLAADLQRLRAAAGGSGGRNAAREADANWVLGLLALHGVAMPQDPVQAFSRFERARQLGHKKAAAGLAWCTMDGCVGVPEPAAARRWVSALRASDPGRALYLDWLIERRVAALHVAGPHHQRAPVSFDAEPQELVRAAQAGDAQALLELGIIRAEQGSLEQAASDFRAAAGVSPAAAANLSIVNERLQARARPPAEPSAQQLFEQARRLHRGEGVPANYGEAIALYRKAAARGSAPAQRMLQMILTGNADGQINVTWMAQLARLDASQAVTVSVVPPSGAPALQRDPTPLYDLLPARWRMAAAAR